MSINVKLMVFSYLFLQLKKRNSGIIKVDLDGYEVHNSEHPLQNRNLTVHI